MFVAVKSDRAANQVANSSGSLPKARSAFVEQKAKVSLKFCSGLFAVSWRALFENKVIDDEGNLTDLYRNQPLPCLEGEEASCLAKSLFSSSPFLEILANWMKCPQPIEGSENKTVSLKGYYCVGSTVPHLLFGKVPLENKEGRAFLHRCLASLNMSTLYNSLVEKKYAHAMPSDIDVRAKMEVLQPLSERDRHEVYQAFRSTLSPKAPFVPGIEGINNQFSVIRVKLPKVKEEIDFIVCFSSSRKCVFTLDSLALFFIPEEDGKSIKQMEVISYLQHPLQGVIDHITGCIRVAKQGDAPVDARAWLKLISYMGKGYISRSVNQERELFQKTFDEYLSGKSKGVRGFVQVFGRWLYTHHQGDPWAAFVFLLNMLQLLQGRIKQEHITAIVTRCSKWQRFLKLQNKKEVWAHLVKSLFVVRDPSSLTSLFACLTLIAYLIDCQQKGKSKVRRVYHEGVPFFQLRIQGNFLSLPYEPLAALKTLVTQGFLDSERGQVLEKECLSIVITLFPIGCFWKMKKTQKSALADVLDVSMLDPIAIMGLDVSSPLIFYLSLLIVSANGTYGSDKTRAQLILAYFPRLLSICPTKADSKALWAFVQKALGCSIDKITQLWEQEKFSWKSWMSFLVDLKLNKMDPPVIAYAVWEVNGKQKDDDEAAFLLMGNLMGKMVVNHPQKALSLLVHITRSSCLENKKNEAVNWVIDALVKVQETSLLLALAQQLPKLIEKKISAKKSLRLLPVLAKLLKADLTEALSLLKLLTFCDQEKKMRIWCVVLTKNVGFLSDLEVFTLFIDYIKPLLARTSEDEALKLLLLIAKGSLATRVVEEVKQLHHCTDQGKKIQSAFLLKVAKDHPAQKEVDGSLFPHLQKEEKKELAISLLKQSYEKKLYKESASHMLFLLKESDQLGKEQPGYFKGLVKNSPLSIAWKLVQTALVHKKLSVREALSYLIFLLEQDVHNQDIAEKFLSVLEVVDVTSLNEKEKTRGLDILIKLLEAYPLIPSSFLFEKKSLLSKVLPVFFLWSLGVKRKQVACLIYKNDVRFKATFSLANAWVEVVDQTEPLHEVYDLLKFAEKIGLTSFNSLKARIAYIKGRLLLGWSKDPSKWLVVQELFFQLIGKNKCQVLHDYIHKAYELLTKALMETDRYKKAIFVFNTWYATQKTITEENVRSLVQCFLAIDDCSEAVKLLLQCKILQEEVALKKDVAHLVKKIAGLLVLTKARALHEKLSSLFFAYFSAFLPQEGKQYTEAEQSIIVDAIRGLKKKKEKRLLALLGNPAFFDAFSLPHLKEQVVEALIEKILLYPSKSFTRLELLNDCKNLLNKHLRDKSNCSVEVLWLAAFFEMRTASGLEKGIEEVKAWLGQRHSVPIWKDFHEKITTNILFSRKGNFKDDFLLLLGKAALVIPPQGECIINIINGLLSQKRSQFLLLAGKFAQILLEKKSNAQLPNFLTTIVSVVDALFNDHSLDAIGGVALLIPHFRACYSDQVDTQYSVLADLWSLKVGVLSFDTLEKEKIETLLHLGYKSVLSSEYDSIYRTLMKVFADFIALLLSTENPHVSLFVTYLDLYKRVVEEEKNKKMKRSNKQKANKIIYIISQSLSNLSLKNKNSLFCLELLGLHIALLKKDYNLSVTELKNVLADFHAKTVEEPLSLAARNLKYMLKQQSRAMCMATLLEKVRDSDVDGILDRLKTLLSSKKESDFSLVVSFYTFVEDILLKKGVHLFMEFFPFLVSNCVQMSCRDTAMRLVWAHHLNLASFPQWREYIFDGNIPLQILKTHARTIVYATIQRKLGESITQLDLQMFYIGMAERKVTAEEHALILSLLDLLKRDFSEENYRYHPLHLICQLIRVIPYFPLIEKSSSYYKLAYSIAEDAKKIDFTSFINNHGYTSLGIDEVMQQRVKKALSQLNPLLDMLCSLGKKIQGGDISAQFLDLISTFEQLFEKKVCEYQEQKLKIHGYDEKK